MSNYCMIETAFGNKSELDQVVNELLNNKLVASCQVVESDSKWSWKNELEKSHEYLAFMKTKKNLVKEIFETIKKVHSYECFEFATFELNSCNEDYLKWIENETKDKYIENQDIKIKKCTSDDVDSIYDIQNIVIDNFKKEEKGFFLPFNKESYLRIVNNPVNDGEIYGAFIDNKMIAWIFLSVSDRMKELKQMVPNLEGSCADIDGVIVLPEYRGYGLQKTLVKYLEKRAKEKGISNIIAEVTFGNVYSLRNLKDLGYEEKTWYQKDENIKRYILLKKLGQTKNK